MIKIEEYKETLGNLLDNLTEAQIFKLIRQQEAMSEMIFALWLEERPAKGTINT